MWALRGLMSTWQMYIIIIDIVIIILAVSQSEWRRLFVAGWRRVWHSAIAPAWMAHRCHRRCHPTHCRFLRHGHLLADEGKKKVSVLTAVVCVCVFVCACARARISLSCVCVCARARASLVYVFVRLCVFVCARVHVCVCVERVCVRKGIHEGLS